MANNNRRSFIRLALGIACFVILAGYAAFQARALIAGPEIAVTNPQNGARIETDNGEALITGTAERISFLTLNGTQIFVDSEGRFAHPISLLPGTNVVTLQATDKFNRQNRVSLQLTYRD